MAAFFARALFESALAAIGTNIVESAVAGSDEVGSAVVGRWVAGCWLIHCQSDFRCRSASGWHIWRLRRVFGGRRGAISSPSFENTRTRHCRVVVVVLVAMAGRTKFFAFFFDGVLLSQKTHELLLASV